MRFRDIAHNTTHRKTAALLLVVLLAAAAFSACAGGERAGYRIITLGDYEEHCFAFRAGDPARELFCAALSELKADGIVAELAIRWLGGDYTEITGQPSAIGIKMSELGLDSIAERDFILGIDDLAAPFSFSEDGEYAGFDIDLARAACEKLGWRLKIQPITSFDVTAELLSGNIDCAGGSLGMTVSDTKTEVTEPYLSERYVLLVPAQSAIKRKKQLDGEKIVMRDDIETINALLEGDSFAGINVSKEYLEDMNACLNALKNGQAAAILAGEFTAEYWT